MQICTKADWRTEGVDKDWMKNLIINKLSTCWIAPRCSQCNALKLSSPNWKWINHLQTVASLALCSSCWCCTSDRSVTPAKGRREWRATPPSVWVILSYLFLLVIEFNGALTSLGLLRDCQSTPPLSPLLIDIRSLTTWDADQSARHHTS